MLLAMPEVVQLREIPESIRSMSAMNDPGYVDVFTLATSRAGSRSAEQWARAVLEDAAGAAGQVVWRGVVGLSLAWRVLPNHVAGWEIAERGQDWIRAEATSWFLTAHLVIWVDQDMVGVATFIGYDRPGVAARLWPPMAAVHRRAMPRVLDKAALVPLAAA
jgi:hypothetical protein